MRGMGPAAVFAVLSDFAAASAVALLLGSVAVVLFRSLVGPAVQLVSRRVQCPLLGRAADCVLVRNVRTGGWKSVAHCPLRLESGRSACTSQCLRVLELKTAIRSEAVPPERTA